MYDEEAEHASRWGHELDIEIAGLKKERVDLRRRVEAHNAEARRFVSERDLIDRSNSGEVASYKAKAGELRRRSADLKAEAADFDRRVDEYNIRADAHTQLECRVKERQATSSQISDDNHNGGFARSEHGWIEEHPVTFSLGWGTKNGETLIAAGHLSWEEFRRSCNHDHYGKGEGPNNNGTLRFAFGPCSCTVSAETPAAAAILPNVVRA